MDRGEAALRTVPIAVDVHLEGLTLLADPPSANLDVVFIHGFTGHPQRTWSCVGEVPQVDRATQSNDDSETPSKFRRLLSSGPSKRAVARKTVFWPHDLLPTTLPNARVYTYGYDSTIRHRFGAPASKSTVYDLSHSLLLNLEVKRNSQPSRPLIFVAHSLGGIVVKEALRQSESHRTHHTHLHSIYDATIAILCFGTPHSGADPRGVIHHVVESVLRLIGYTPNDQLINSLLPSSERLRELRDEFSRMSRTKEWMLFSFQEQYGIKALNGKKVVEDTSSTFGDPTIEIAQHISSDHMDMCRFKGLDDTEYGKVAAALRRISQIVEDDTGQQQACSNSRPHVLKQNNLTGAVSADDKEVYLNSLAFLQIDARLLNIKKAHSETCDWLFEQPEFKQWLDRDLTAIHHGFLWIKGKPGAGKSTIMKHTLLKSKELFTSAVIVSFFFNARGEILEKSTLGMYRSLLLQLLKAIPFLQDEFILTFSKNRKHIGVYEWNIEELQELLILAVKGLQQQRLVCFIDALDECEENEVREMVEFLESLGETAVLSRTSLNICLSSRHYPHIRIEKGIQLTVEGQSDHAKDIAKYVESKFKIPHSKQMDDIRAEILSRASGVFLWVVLVVQMLNKEYDHGQIHTLRQRLSEIPDELDDLFADILVRDAERRDESILCLQWLLFAQRPLKREELYLAVISGTKPTALGKWDPNEVSYETIDRFILSCSKGLAEVSKAKDQTIQFIHESVRDFFLSRNGLVKMQADLVINMVGISQDRLKHCCYQYIMTDMFQDLSKEELPNANSGTAKDLRNRTSETFPFLEYAVHNILIHADLAQSYGTLQKDFLKEFHPPSLVMRNWIKFDSIFQRSQVRRYSRNANLLYILSEKNLSSLVEISLDCKADIDLSGERYGNAIQAASANGHAKIVRLLIDAGADINGVGGKYGDSLTAAISKNHEAVVELLLKEGATQNTMHKRYRAPLIWAIENGHETVVQILLSKPLVDLNSKDNSGRTPLFLAVENRHEAIVQILLSNYRVDLNSKDNYGWTPLSLAARNGYEAVVQILLSNPLVDLNSKDSSGCTPLFLAVGNRHEAIVQILLSNPLVDLNSKDNYGWTPLSLAARNGYEAVVQILLSNPLVDPNSKDFIGQTPLSWAAEGKNLAMVKLLLSSPKVDPNLGGIDGHTPLSWATLNSNEDIVQLLLLDPRVRSKSENNSS